MTLTVVVIPELNSGQVLANPPADGQKLKVFYFTF